MFKGCSPCVCSSYQFYGNFITAQFNPLCGFNPSTSPAVSLEVNTRLHTGSEAGEHSIFYSMLMAGEVTLSLSLIVKSGG